jgi:hypothetical protein
VSHNNNDNHAIANSATTAAVISPSRSQEIVDHFLKLQDDGDEDRFDPAFGIGCVCV